MSIFVIADLHLAFNENKPMDIFGENWEGHDEKIKKSWKEKVKENDLVVLPGDFSWSMYLENTIQDFEYHDYWWTTVTSMRKFLKENNFTNIDFIYNNSYEFENYIIAGTRGWNLTEEGNEKMLNREAIRLEISLQNAIKKYGEEKEIIVFMHYPPIVNANLISNKESKFIAIMKKYNVKKCFYGHLHGTSINEAIEGKYFGIEFKLISSDKLDFNLYKIN